MSEVFEPGDKDGTRPDGTTKPVKQFSFTSGISKALKAAAHTMMVELRANPTVRGPLLIVLAPALYPPLLRDRALVLLT